MGDRRGIPSDSFTRADVLRFFGCLFLNFQNFHNFQRTAKICFQMIHLSEMQTAFSDGHIAPLLTILSMSPLDDVLYYRRSSYGLLVTINNFLR